MEYSVEFREQVIEKALSSGQGQGVLAEGFGIGRSTLQKWLRDYRNSGEQSLAKQEKRPADWSEEERFAAVLETAQLGEEEVGRWCRAHGLHTHQLKRWRQDALLGKGGGKARAEQAEARRLREENRLLKKELRRKDKALAETTALLVLKKKPSRFGGSARTIDW